MLLGLFDGSALVGLGEASPLPDLSADSLRDAAKELRDLVAPASLPRSLDEAADWCGKQNLESPSARFATETALLDAAARQRGEAFGSLLGYRRSAERSILVGHIDDPDRIRRAASATARGARSLKFKAAGRDPANESARIIEMRRSLEVPLRIRLDLNGSLNADGARRALDHYARAEIELVEEPARGVDLLELGACAVPWFVDESLANPRLRKALLEEPAAAGFVIKPSLLGGVQQSWALAAEARSAGKQLVVTHAFEGPVALAACSELALALASPSAGAHGLDLHAALSAFPPARIAQLPNSAPAGEQLQVEATSNLGLGVELPERIWPSRI